MQLIKDLLNSPQVIFISLILIALPNIEAVKNLLVLIFVIYYFFNFVKDKVIFNDLIFIDYIFFLWLLIDIIVALNAIYNHDQPGAGFNDVFRYLAFGWIVSRLNLSNIEVKKITLYFIFFSFVSLIISIYLFGYGTNLRLNSAGDLNHSVIYLTIVYSISLSYFLFAQPKTNKYQQFLLVVNLLFLFIVIANSLSRAGFGIIIIISLLQIFAKILISKNKSRYLIIGFLFISIMPLAVQNFAPDLIERYVNGTQLIGDSPRSRIRNMAYYVFKIDPIFGVGMDNFPNYQYDDIKDLVIQEEGSFDKEKLSPFQHPHNIYFAMMVGGGMLMLSIFVLFFIKILLMIYGLRKNIDEMYLSVGVFSIVLMNLLIGYVNTTFANEVALLSMTFIGAFLSRYRQTKNLNQS